MNDEEKGSRREKRVEGGNGGDYKGMNGVEEAKHRVLEWQLGRDDTCNSSRWLILGLRTAGGETGSPGKVCSASWSHGGCSDLLSSRLLFFQETLLLLLLLQVDYGSTSLLQFQRDTRCLFGDVLGSVGCGSGM
ncbi:hypothetical protein LOK49_LG08G00052 [Camellia lanceoleosa]|uniref:Uncharacterized protein n=1 Tax=Camellia lanceoleosa TaxID=1840588 RepID=A0ACC0GM71_9ERIC|nr:hypothetical protein LOK49_LG08G00052 [Camellia lanceoleosa]